MKKLAIWGLSAAMVAAGVVLTVAGAGSARPIISSIHLPVWGLLLAFAAAERFVVHVHFRRSAHSMSIGEIPLVFALVFATGQDVILASVIGRLLILALHRRLPPIRLAFNLGHILLGTAVAVLAFHLIAVPAHEIGPRVWAAAALAMVANSVLAVLLISLAVSLSDGPLSIGQIASSLRTDLTMVLADTSIGLCAVTLVDNDWRTAILLAVPVVGMFLSFQAYIGERQRHDRLEFLYDAARALSHSIEVGQAVEALLARAVEAFRADGAEIVFLAPDGRDAVRTSMRAGAEAAVVEAVPAHVVAPLRRLVEDPALGARPAREIGPGPLSQYLEQQDLAKGMVAALRGERTSIGAIMIGNPSGRVDRFTPEDVKLLETLANNTSIALENDRLGQAVWQMRERETTLEHRASHDPLTDLANRRLFTERVDAALNRDGGDVAVIFIDVNDFKTVNDSLGHAAGDELLVAIAGRLRECVRPADTLARLGGDEFAVMLEQPGPEQDAVDIARRIDRSLAQPFSIAGRRLVVGASTGIAAAPAHAITADELIGHADVAMYRAKQSGKGGYELYSPGMDVPVTRRPRSRRPEAAPAG